MTVFVLLAICGLVLLILARPFRQAPPPGAQAPPAPLPDAGASSTTDRGAREPAGATAVPSSVPPGLAVLPHPPDRTRLLDEKDRLIQALRDLRFDFEAGKLSPEDFEREDGRLRARAARVLGELEG